MQRMIPDSLPAHDIAMQHMMHGPQARPATAS